MFRWKEAGATLIVWWYARVIVAIAVALNVLYFCCFRDIWVRISWKHHYLSVKCVAYRLDVAFGCMLSVFYGTDPVPGSSIAVSGQSMIVSMLAEPVKCFALAWWL